jgi:hypothetical protein
MNLENTVLSEISLSQKDKCGIISFTGVSHSRRIHREQLECSLQELGWDDVELVFNGSRALGCGGWKCSGSGQW